MNRPNILLITADQWRGDCLSIEGHPHVATPNLDALASESVRFGAHYAGAAPCAPARACLYTGLYTMNHRVVSNGTPLDARHDNLAHLARRAGYEPVLFGHTDVAVDPRQCDSADPRLRDYEGALTGFGVRTVLDESELTWRSWLQAQGVDGAFDSRLHQPPLRYARQQTQTAFLVDEFNRWALERHHALPQATPWFAHLSLIRPHPPFVVPPPYDTQVPPQHVTIQGAETNATALMQHPYLQHIARTQAKSSFLHGHEGLSSEWSVEQRQAIAATYFGMVSEVDAQLGRLFEHLKALQMWKNTLVVFTSDHGEMLGQHGFFGKFGFFDASYHIPLIIKDPAMSCSPGTRISEFTEAVDILPTLASRLERSLNDSIDGHSLLPWLSEAPPATWRKHVHWEHDFRDALRKRSSRQEYAAGELAGGLPTNMHNHDCSITVRRSHTDKYVHFGALPPLLFDLIEDPDESVDRSCNPDWQQRRLESAEALLSWRARHLDQTLTNVSTADVSTPDASTPDASAQETM